MRNSCIVLLVGTWCLCFGVVAAAVQHMRMLVPLVQLDTQSAAHALYGHGDWADPASMVAGV